MGCYGLLSLERVAPHEAGRWAADSRRLALKISTLDTWEADDNFWFQRSREPMTQGLSA